MASGHRLDLAVVQLGDIGGLIEGFLAAGVPTVLYIHDQYTFDTLDDRLRNDQRLSLAACSSFIAEYMRKAVGRQPVIFPVLIEPSLYRVNTRGNYATIVNPIPRKGSEIVFALAASRPDIPFAFVEAWKLRNRVWKYLEARAAHHGNIQLFRRTEDMREIYSLTRVIVAPSQGSEAWGRVVSEAQVSGIPAVASDSGGLPEAVGPGGLVVGRHADIKEWLSALSRLWDDQTEYENYSASARRHAERDDFQPSAIAERLIATLKLLSRQ
jgi:glycosyltransferase involved in cell wall biosynthesis